MTSSIVPAEAHREPALRSIGRPEYSLALGARPPTRVPALFGIMAIVVFVGGFFAWSALAPLSRAAVAAGIIAPIGNVRTIQHLEGGIIRQILVKDGDVVHKGQVLMRLDGIAADSNTVASRAMRWDLMAQVARTQAELKGADRITFPAELTRAAESDPYAVEAMQAQRTLFLSRLASLQGQVKVLMLRADEAKAQVNAADGQLTSLQRQLDLIDTEMADVTKLLRSGLETKPHLYALQRTVAQIIGNKNEALAERARAESQISEAYAQIAALQDQRMQEASTELRDSSSRLASATERLRAAADVSKRLAIVAPDDGTVMGLRFFTVGAVIRPGDAVMQLAPLHDGFIADVRVQAHDIDAVHPGMPAEVRFPAFSSRLTPYLKGTVTYVAPDATQDDKSHISYYQAKVRISDAQLKRLPPSEKVLYGMPVLAEIQAGQRTLFEYLIQPLRNSFYMAFHES